MASSAGTIFGADVSHHQNTLPPAALASIDFLIARTAQAKGGKYGTIKDLMYGTHKRAALAAGLLFSAYFYIGNGLTAQQNVDLHASIEPDRSVPVMLDWEEGSGSASFLRAVHAAFVVAGYTVWSSYAPRWYWQSQGSASLAGLPPLVSSRYPNNVPGPLASEWAETPEAYWAGYGGLSVLMIQFTSSGRLPGYNGNLDLNAFRGTRAQLAEIFHNTPGVLQPSDNEGADMALIETIKVASSATEKALFFRKLPGGDNCKLTIRVPGIDPNPQDGVTEARKAKEPVWLGHVYAYGTNDQGIGHDPVYDPDYNPRVDYDRDVHLPGALLATLNYSCNLDFEIDVYG